MKINEVTRKLKDIDHALSAFSATYNDDYYGVISTAVSGLEALKKLQIRIRSVVPDEDKSASYNTAFYDGVMMSLRAVNKIIEEIEEPKKWKT